MKKHKTHNDSLNSNQAKRAFPALRECAEVIGDCTSIKPTWAVVFGSGMSPVAEIIEEKVIFPYESLPGFSPTSVEGHPGQLVMGRIGGNWVAAFLGRIHIYEGLGESPVLAPVRLARELGVKNIILTNAAGGLHHGLGSGCLMAITSHINLMWDNGSNLTQTTSLRRGIYDTELTEVFVSRAKSNGIQIFSGVYAALTGPTYETPAETRAYRKLGADAVGMSTALEAIEAATLGLRVLGISCITNDASPQTDTQEGPSHKAVLASANSKCSALADAIKLLLEDPFI